MYIACMTSYIHYFMSLSVCNIILTNCISRSTKHTYTHVLAKGVQNTISIKNLA